MHRVYRKGIAMLLFLANAVEMLNKAMANHSFVVNIFWSLDLFAKCLLGKI